MALEDAYATVTDYRDFTAKTDMSDENEILMQLTAVSRYLDRELGQFFGKDAGPVARVLYGTGSPGLALNQEGAPGIATAAGLIVTVDSDGDGDFSDETPADNADLTLWPYNAALQPEPRPFRILGYRNGSTAFTAGRLVEVTAEWGWPSVPNSIREATMRLTAIWRGESPGATQRFNELDQVVAESPLSMSMVKRLRMAYKHRLVG